MKRALTQQQLLGYGALALCLLTLGLYILVTGATPGSGTGVDGVRTGIVTGWTARLMGLAAAAFGAFLLRQIWRRRLQDQAPRR